MIEAARQGLEKMMAAERRREEKDQRQAAVEAKLSQDRAEQGEVWEQKAVARASKQARAVRKARRRAEREEVTTATAPAHAPPPSSCSPLATALGRWPSLGGRWLPSPCPIIAGS